MHDQRDAGVAQGIEPRSYGKPGGRVQRGVAGGDSLNVFYDDSEESGGRDALLYASLTTRGETYRYYRFQTPDDGLVDYYDDNGRSSRKFLVRKPIATGETRSGFGYRRHPILGYYKMHTGVDWAAPIGTPIFAAGNGVVIMAEWHGGYGRRVEVQHANGYITAYNHMSGFARDIAKGVRVKQGQTVGFLGSTGLSTGPHLHYEVMVNGHFVDPMRVKLARTREFDGKLLADFKRERDRIDQLMAKAPRLRVIGRAGVGVDNIDAAAATRRGIVVMNTPGANAVAVAELTIALMLGLARKLPKANSTMHAGQWEKKSLQGAELRGKTLGILGLGRIGLEVAKRAKGFGLEIIGSDPFVSAAVARENGIKLVTLDELIAGSDYITLHVGLTPQTAGVINAKSIAAMKKGVRIVNCARGELIEDAALVEALKSGQVGGAALDVFAVEPLKDSP